MPTLYHQWLLNVISANLTEHVLPLVAPSLMGARVLDYLRLSVDVLYLDSAHELRETFMELTAYWPLIRPGGVLLGDDFNWRAVSTPLIAPNRVSDPLAFPLRKRPRPAKLSSNGRERVLRSNRSLTTCSCLHAFTASSCAPSMIATSTCAPVPRRGCACGTSRSPPPSAGKGLSSDGR